MDLFRNWTAKIKKATEWKDHVVQQKMVPKIILWLTADAWDREIRSFSKNLFQVEIRTILQTCNVFFFFFLDKLQYRAIFFFTAKLDWSFKFMAILSRLFFFMVGFHLFLFSSGHLTRATVIYSNQKTNTWSRGCVYISCVHRA